MEEIDRAQGVARIKEAVEDYWGERCSDFHEGCCTCRVWAFLDKLLAHGN